MPISSYQRYKDDTPASSTRLKGKDRKLTKQAAIASGNPKSPAQPNEPRKTYKVSVAELLRQVEAVASWTKKTIRLPTNVQRVLQRAITARQRCTAWFRKTGLQNGFSNEGHEYFVNVLQRAMQLLRGSAPSTSAAGSSNAPNGSADILSNRFAALDFDEDDIGLDVEDVEIEPTVSANARKKGPPAAYEIEDEIFDVAFAIYCFFEDAHWLQAELAAVWKEQRANRVDLLSATELTTTALDLFWHSEAQLYHEYRSYFQHGIGRTYDDLAAVVFSAEAIRAGEDPDEAMCSPERLKILPFDEFIYLPNARTLMKFAQLKKFLDVGIWPPPVPPMRFNYAIDPSLLEAPHMPKYEQEDKLLSQLMLDMALADSLSDEMAKMSQKSSLHSLATPQVTDVLSSYLRETFGDGKVSLTGVLASRVWLDIIELHGGKSDSASILAAESAQAQNSFQFDMDASGTMEVGGGVRWLTKDDPLLFDIYSLKLKIDRAPFSEYKKMRLAASPEQKEIDMDDPNIDPALKQHVERQLQEKHPDWDWSPPEQKHVENAKRMNIRMIRPNEDERFLMEYNPLYCGTAALDLALKTEEAGIALANHHMSIFSTAHLYNALRQLKVIEIEWPGLERISELQVGPIFAGQRPGDLPTTPQAMETHMQLRLGLKSTSKLFDKKLPWKLQLCSAGVVDSWLAEIDPKTKYNKPRRHLSLLQFVKHYSEVLPGLIDDIRIDYIGLTKICNALMVAIRAKLSTELGVDYPSMKKPGESNDHGSVYMVMGILAENKKAEMAHQRLHRRGNEVFAGGEQLRVAGRALEEFLKNKHRRQIKPRQATA